MKDPVKSFRARMRSGRGALGISQSELERRAKLPPSVASMYENGSRTPGIDTLSRIATALQVSTDYLLGREVVLRREGKSKIVVHSGETLEMALERVQKHGGEAPNPESELSYLRDRLDMCLDEFQRISVKTEDAEIKGLCERGITDIRQRVPMIDQRDNAEKKLRDERAKRLRAMEAVKRLLVAYSRRLYGNWYEKTAEECGLELDGIGNIKEPELK